MEKPAVESTPVEPEIIENENVFAGSATESEPEEVIDLTGTREVIGVGETVYVNALLNGEQALFTYASNNVNVASVTASGMITGVSEGTAKITVTAQNGTAAVLALTVKSAPSVIVFAETSLIIGEDSTHQILWSFEGDAAGAIEWFSANELVVSVDKNGVLTANGIGATAVQARAYNGAIATCAVTVMAEPSDITLNVSEAELGEGEEMKIGAFFTGDTYGKVSFNVTSGDGEIQITDNGDNTATVKALKSGTVTLTASVENAIEGETYTAECVITIVPAPVTIVFGNTRTTIGYKETIYLEPVAYDGRGNVIETAFKYATSASKYVSVKGEGIYGAAKGSATITVAAENGAKNAVKITTVTAPSKVTIAAPTATISVGETVPFGYTLPAGQAGSVKWQIEHSYIAEVDVTGNVTGLTKGTTRLRVQTYNGKYALLTIKVTDAPETLSFNKTEYYVPVGCTTKTQLTVQPEEASTRVAYAFEGSEYASIDENGVITGIAVGSFKLTATVHNYVDDIDVVAECMVHVVPGPHTIVFENPRTTIGYKETMSLDPVVYDEFGDVVEAALAYKSSKTGYVSISGNNIYGKAKGTSVITVTAENGVSASVTIKTVTEPSKVTVTADSVNLAVGETTQAHYAFPSGQAGTATWRVENASILTIDENGVITALSKGTTRVRADSYNKKYGLLTINVVDAPESIAFAQATYQLGEGQSFKPVLTALPAGASTNATYEVVAGDLITVSENGTVTAGTTLGTATLRATVHNFVTNADVVCECQIEIVPAPVTIEFRNERTVIGYGETVDLEPYALDGRGNEVETTFKLASSNTRYVSIKSGKVYGAGKGTATVTVAAANGASTKVTITTVSAPSKVTISAESTLISVGETMQMTAVLPSGQTGAVTWRVENGAILSIDEDGLVTALSNGTTRVRVDTFNKKYALLTINVVDAPESIAFANAAYQLGEGETKKFAVTATPVGASSNATYEIISGSDLATIDERGNVTAGTNLGTITLRATVHDFVKDTDVTAQCQIEIVPAPVTIEFRNERTVIGYGETVDLEPYALDGRGNEVETTFKLASSNTRYVSIKSGKVYGAGKGTATVTVTAANGASAQVAIKTVSAPSKVAISAPSAKMAVGDTMALSAVIPSDQVGNVTWRAENTAILTVDADGVVTAHSAGSTRVRVDTFNRKYALYTISVYPAPASLEFAQDEAEITVGMKYVPALTLTPDNAYATPTYAFVKEGNGEEPVVIDGVNIVGNCVGSGILTVSYTCPDGSYLYDEQKIVVKPAPATIKLNVNRTTIGQYETLSLNPVAYDENGNEVDTTFAIKSSSTGYIQVKGESIYGVRRGSAKITVAAHNGVAVTTTFKVVAAPSKVTVKADDAVISQTGSTKVHAAFDAGKAGSVTWTSSNEAIATVDANGVVIAKNIGTVSFKATSHNGKYGICTIEVKAEPTGISFAVDSTLVGEEGTKTVKASLPEGCAGAVTYSSANPYVASVNPVTGLVTGIRQGKTMITATTINNLTGECFADSYELTVTPKPVKVVLHIGRDKIGLKEIASLEAVAYDEFGNVTEGSFTFKSSRTNYVAINDLGEIYGKARGYSDITVTTYNGITVKQRFTTVYAPTAIAINHKSITMSELDSATLLTATSSGSSSSVKWTSSDETVAKVDQKGVVTAVSFGTCIVTAETYNGKKASSEVIIKYEPSAVAFDNDTDKVGEGNSRVITAHIPEDCFGPITYASSDPETAPVDAATGKVVGLKKGTVTITATVTNRKTGESFSDTYELTVTPKPVKIEIHADRVKVGVGEILPLNAVAYDADGNVTDGGFTYASSRTGYVLVNANGEVKGVKVGYSDITVKTYNGVSIKGRITVVKAPTEVTISKESIRISEIDTYQLAMKLSSGSIGAYTWTSSDENVVTVDQNGLVTAVGFGTADIIVTTYNGKAAVCKVKVCYEPETVIFPEDTVTLGELASITVKAELGDDYIGEIEYISGNENIATVDAKTGKVTGILAGETTIIAKTVNRKTGEEITGICNVVVTPAPAKVEILTKITKIGYKEKIKIDAIAYDAAGNVIDGQLKLATSNSRYVQVNELMEMYGAYRGSATVGVIAYNGVFASMKVTVASAPTSVSLNKTSLKLIIGNDPVQLTASLPSGTASQIKWETQDASIATIDENGYVTPVSFGTTKVRCVTFNGKYNVCTVSVFEAPQSVTLSDEEIMLGEKQTYALTAQLNEHAAGEITFSSSSDAIATVDANGKVTAVKEGECVITAETYNGKTDTCKVTVKKAPSSVKFSLPSITIGINQSVDVSDLVMIPDDSAASFKYEVKSSYTAKISAAGVITGAHKGTTELTVITHNGMSAKLGVTVIAAPETLTLVIGNTDLYIGETAKYKVTLPGGMYADYTITSSNPDVVRVDTETEQLVAVSKGKATITAQAYNGIIKTQVVEVLKHVESVSLNKTEISIVHHETFQLEASVLPEDASDRSVTWTSSDPEKVSVDENGLITAEKVTDTPVTISVHTKDLDLIKSCQVTVTPVRVTGIELDKHALTLEKARMAQLFVSFTPDNADDQSVTWKSSDESLLTVGETGIIEAIGHEGTVTVTVTSNDGGFTDECVVTLTRIKMEKMTIPESMTIIQYETRQMTPVFTPADAECVSVVYESMNESVLKVSETGMLEALEIGNAVIKVTATDYFGKEITGECSVAVLPVPVDSVELSLEDLEIRAGKTQEITVTVLPDNAFNKAVTWVSSNEEAATITVDPTDGHKATINALAGGETVITVTSQDGGKTDTLNVLVFDALGAALTPNHAKNTTGNTISWTAEALNAIGEAGFTFTVVKEGQSEPVVSITEFGAQNTVSIESAAAGTYTATVTVKDSLNDTAVMSSTIVVADCQQFVSGSNVYTYVVMPGAAADGSDGAAIKFADPSAAPASVVIPAVVDGVPVVVIDDEAFMNATTLASVSVPETVTVIGARAFKGCTALSNMTSHTAE